MSTLPANASGPLRSAVRVPFFDVLRQDLRYTLRTLGRDLSFTIVAVLILALGIGANIAVFSVVDALLLRPLPFPEPQNLAWVQGPPQSCGMSCVTYSVDAFEEYQRQTRTLAGVTAYFPFQGANSYKLTGRGIPVPLSGLPVEGNFFQVLGVQPILGRLFNNEETQLHGRPAVLLSYPFWLRQFHGDASLIGQTIALNNAPVTVIGVLPPAFDFGSVFAPGTKTDVFVPAINDEMRNWGNVFLLVGRLRPGTSLAQAHEEAQRLFPTFYVNKSHPEYGKGYEARLEPLKEHVSGSLRRSLQLLWCAVGVILLIVCVNLSNLLLSRSAARSREFAIRAALGAGRGRIIRQLLTESAMLSAAGALLGWAIAFAIVTYLAKADSIALPLLNNVHMNAIAVAWTVLVAAGTAVLFGMAAALRMSGKDLQSPLRESGTGATASRQHETLRSALVVGEVALACVLVVCAGLLLRSFLKVTEIDLGFEPDHAAALQVDYDDSSAKDGKSAARLRGAIFQNMLDHVKAIPGVVDAGVTDMLPLDRNRSWNLSTEGLDCGRHECPDALVQVVTPGYLGAMGTQLREGRDFTWADQADSAGVVVLNQAAAKLLWPGRDPLGRKTNLGRVVGIVADVRDTAVEGGSDGPEIYVPIMQSGPAGAELVVRTRLPTQMLAATVMGVLRQLNPGQPSTEFRPLRTVVDHAVSPRRFFMLLVSLFAGLGLLLAVLGIYGVISYSVTRQTQEIGIRMALGASRGRVLRGVLGWTLRLSVLGLVVGLGASFAAARAVGSLLYGTDPTDLVTYATVIGLLLVVAVLAGYLPARRASRISPLSALRTS